MSNNYNLISDFEDLLIKEVEKIINQIISDKIQLNISAKSRAGAEISDYLEEQFSKKGKELSRYISNIEKSPKGATKNPWDLRFDFNFKKNCEEIWVDFKALKISSLDSNPEKTLKSYPKLSQQAKRVSLPLKSNYFMEQDAWLIKMM